jgi:hypothetical protein
MSSPANGTYDTRRSEVCCSLLSHPSSSGPQTALSRERGALDAVKGRVNQWTEGESALGHNRRQLHVAADGFHVTANEERFGDVHISRPGIAASMSGSCILRPSNDRGSNLPDRADDKEEIWLA